MDTITTRDLVLLAKEEGLKLGEEPDRMIRYFTKIGLLRPPTRKGRGPGSGRGVEAFFPPESAQRLRKACRYKKMYPSMPFKVIVASLNRGGADDLLPVGAPGSPEQDWAEIVERAWKEHIGDLAPELAGAVTRLLDDALMPLNAAKACGLEEARQSLFRVIAVGSTFLAPRSSHGVHDSMRGAVAAALSTAFNRLLVEMGLHGGPSKRPARNHRTTRKPA